MISIIKSVNNISNKTIGKPLLAFTASSSKTVNSKTTVTALGDKVEKVISNTTTNGKSNGKSNGIINVDLSVSADTKTLTASASIKNGHNVSINSEGCVGIGSSKTVKSTDNGANTVNDDLIFTPGKGTTAVAAMATTLLIPELKIESAVQAIPKILLGK